MLPVKRLKVIPIHRVTYKTATILLLLTTAAFLIHGYHPYAEDAEIYLPGIEHTLNPALFPVGQEYFQSHASMTWFPNLVALFERGTHLPFEVVLLLWQAASIFLLLLACWRLSGILFDTARARWAAVCLVTALLTIPVAGTALYIVDQYLNPRNLAAFAAVFTVVEVLQRKYLLALIWIVFAAIVHPLMWVFPFSFTALWIVLEQIERREGIAILSGRAAALMGSLVLIGIPLSQPPPAYHQSALRHTYFYIQDWAWYETLGAVAPLALLWWFGRIAARRGWSTMERACRAFAIYGAIYLLVALVLDIPARFESLARIQPLRSLLLLYVFMFICIGGLVGEYVLRGRVWRWLVLFVPLSIGMFAAQRALFPASAHLELPGRAAKNPWAQAFYWIRENTPLDALFAIDPKYMSVPGEDAVGFRCLAQRSRLADVPKDGGVVSMFPQLANDWWQQVQAQTPWKSFQAADFERLRKSYGVGWVVVQQPGVPGLSCPYQNGVVLVCRTP
jgi:hypothetical protein